MSLTYFDEQAPQWIFGELLSYSFPSPQALTGTLVNALRVDALWVLSTDSIEHVVTLLIGGAEVTSVIVPARAGFDGTAPVDLLGHLATISGWQGMVLPAGEQSQVTSAVAVADGQKILVVGTGGLVPALVGL